MKVLFLLTYYHPYWTGLTQYAKRVAEGLVQKGHQVQVITTQHEQSLPKSENINGVRVLRSHVWLRMSRSMLSGQMIKDIIFQVNSHDIVIVFLPYAEVALVAIWCALIGKRLILVHNGDLVLPWGLGNRLLELIYYTTTALAISLSQTIVIHTTDYALHSPLLSKFKSKWTVILPPIEKMEPDPKLIEKLKAQISSGEKHIVGFAGRFVAEKGFDILLQAIPLVIKDFPEVKFAFAGETQVFYENFFAKNKKLWQDNSKHMTWVGLLKLQDMASFYGLCDVFVVSSRTDCFPVTQIEAMICGTPVVVTDIPGARWPVQQTGMGIVSPKENPEGLAKAIVEVLRNRTRYQISTIKLAKIFNYHQAITAYDQLLK